MGVSPYLAGRRSLDPLGGMREFPTGIWGVAH